MSTIEPIPESMRSQPNSADSPAAGTTLARLQQLLPDLFEPRQQTGELFIKFQIGPDLQAAISLERVVETLQIPSRSVTPIPNMPAATLGLMSTRGQVFWAVDIARLLEMKLQQQRSRRYEVIVIHALPISSLSRANSAPEDELLLGLVVSHIRGTIRFNPDDIESPTEDVLPELTPFLQGQVKQGRETIMVLSVEAISNAREFITCSDNRPG